MVYVIKMAGTSLYKIGFTADATIERRLRSLQTANPAKLELIGNFEGTEFDERRLQSQFIAYQVVGEWFDLPEEAANKLDELLEKENKIESKDDPSSVSGPSAFDVRPLSGRQQYQTPNRGKTVPDERPAFDNARTQSVFPSLLRKQ